jgi:hypothetical protein
VLPGMLVRLAETGPDEPVRFECGSPSFAACPMKPDDRPPKTKRRQSIPASKNVILLERCAWVTPRGAVVFFAGARLGCFCSKKRLEGDLAGAMLLSSS